MGPTRIFKVLDCIRDSTSQCHSCSNNGIINSSIPMMCVSKLPATFFLSFKPGMFPPTAVIARILSINMCVISI
jgi:hypothetical protein